MNDNYGYICASINSPLIGKVVKYDDLRNWYLLELPEKKKDEEHQYCYCNYDLDGYMNEWVEIKIKKYTMYSKKYEVKRLSKNEIKDKF